MAERILDPAEQPAVRLLHRVHLSRSQVDGASNDGPRIVDDEQDAQGAAAERLGTEVSVLGRLVGDQKDALPTASCETTAGCSSVPATR
jgi:hypothetical protein